MPIENNAPKRGVAALCIGGALGYLGQSAQMLWVAAYIANGFVSPSTIGWLASGELLLGAISTLTVSAFGTRLSPRNVAGGAAALLTCSNLLAMYPSIATLALGRLASGIASGALLAAITGVAARRQGAQRVLTLIQGSSLILASVIFLASPKLIGQHGPAGLFALIAGIGGIATFAALVGVTRVPVAAVEMGTEIEGTGRAAPLLACAALSFTCIGASAMQTYMVTIGNRLGFAAGHIATALAVAGPLAMLGPVVSHVLGERIGIVRPLIFGTILLAGDYFLLVTAPTPVFFGLYMALFAATGTFVVPYAITFIGKLNSSGGFASAAPAFLMVGAAAGPALGGKIVGASSIHALSGVAASCGVFGIILFVAAAMWPQASTRRTHMDPPNGINSSLKS